MIAEDKVYKIGRITHTHGVKGEVAMTFTDDVWDRAEAEYLILRIEGILVPFFMEEYRFRSDSTAIMKFEGVDSQDRARELTGCDVFFLRRLADSDEDNLSWAEIVGYSLIDAATHACIGRIASVDDTTINVLFCLEDGRLIPAAENFITRVDTDQREIEIELPQGLLEL